MVETNEKVKNLNMFINRRAELLNILKEKENLGCLTQNKDENLVNDFQKALDECKYCDEKIKDYKSNLLPSLYLSFEDEIENYGNTSNTTALVVKTDNKIINWFKNKINEFKYNYCVERALKRDNFLENNISNQINTYNAYLNVIKVNGNKAIFKKCLVEKITNFNNNEIYKKDKKGI